MARPHQQADLRLLSKVGKLYYEQRLTQQMISERLHLSRPKVSRLLQQAVDEGIVQITVLSPPGIYANLEQQLEERFGLHEAVVVEIDPSSSANSIAKELGSAAASYLQRTVKDNDVIGVSWGATLNAMANALTPIETQNAHVVQLIGGLGPPEAEMHANELCRRIARMLNSRLTLIPAPGIVDRLAVKQALLSDNYVQAAFEMFDKINVALVGIGTPSPEGVLYKSPMVSSAEIESLRSRGAVGDIALRFIDIDGELIPSDLDERVVGISLAQLTATEQIVGVAGGQSKRDVIYGALMGKLINVLITDHTLAAALMEFEPRPRSQSFQPDVQL